MWNARYASCAGMREVLGAAHRARTTSAMAWPLGVNHSSSSKKNLQPHATHVLANLPATARFPSNLRRA